MYISHFKNSKLVQTLLKYVAEAEDISLGPPPLNSTFNYNSFEAQLTAVRNI